MSHNFIIIFIFILLWTKIAHAEIIPTYTINSSTISKIEKIIDENTIIFVELDEVLIMPKSKMFRYNGNPHRLFIHNLINLSNHDNRYLAPVIAWYQSRKVRLVEDGWQNFIKDAKKKGAKIYGFCNMPINLKNIEIHRSSEIKKLGINFTAKINNQEIIKINKRQDWEAIFYKGILFTGPFDKSRTLLDLIKITNISPKKIIVFDKIKSQLKKIEYSGMKAFGIELYNILYLGARQFTDQPDPEIVKLQQKFLLEKNIWLEDNQAARQLQ